MYSVPTVEGCTRLAAGLIALTVFASAPLTAQDAEQQPATPPPEPSFALNANWVDTIHWRSIGPASMGGRITDLAVVESNPSTYYLGLATAGVWKTTDNGETFKPLFTHEAVSSVGDIAIARSNPDILYVGTGENNPRNSVSYGRGVYKSTDAGETWQHIGLENTFQIGRIAVHHTNPDIVYVGALGRLYGSNEDRGLYKSVDGGNSWQKIHYIDENTGVIDVQMHPTDPDTILFATYQRQRGIYDVNTPPIDDGPGGGIWKTTDGGRTIRQLSKTGNGLPTVDYGRVGIDYMRGNPNTVIAIVETNQTGQGTLLPDPDAPEEEEVQAGQRGGRRGGQARGQRRGGGQRGQRGQRGGGRGGRGRAPTLRASLDGQTEDLQHRLEPNGFESGGLFKSTDGGENWTLINTINPRPMYYSQPRIFPNDESKIFVLGTSLHFSEDGGNEFNNRRAGHSDNHAMWISDDGC